MANGGTFIPPGVGRLGGRVAVIPYWASKPPGIGADAVIRIDFGIPEKAVQMAGEGRQIRQPLANTPIYNVGIHIPTESKSPRRPAQSRHLSYRLVTGDAVLFIELPCWSRLESPCGLLEVLDSAKPPRYPVPTGAVLVHHNLSSD
jgi:hypothetical protein